MIIHQREIAYGENYPVFFEALVKAKKYLEKKYPEVSVELMYSLAGKEAVQRFRRAMLRWLIMSESMPKRTTTRSIRSCSSLS